MNHPRTFTGAFSVTHSYTSSSISYLRVGSWTLQLKNNLFLFLATFMIFIIQKL